jgi:hypothetical protein
MTSKQTELLLCTFSFSPLIGMLTCLFVLQLMTRDELEQQVEDEDAANAQVTGQEVVECYQCSLHAAQVLFPATLVQRGFTYT